MNEVYVKILKDIADKIIGEDLVEVESNEDSTRIWVNIRPKDCCGYDCHTIFTEDGFYILDDMKFNSLEFFKEYAKQVVEVKCKEQIDELYTAGIIEKSKSVNKKTFDLSRITEEWFISEFEEIAEEDGNCETVEDFEIEKNKNSVVITFTVNCDRAGRHDDNYITVTDRGLVRTNLSEIIEGGDIDGQIKRSIEKLIKV